MNRPIVLELRNVGKQFRRGAQRGPAYATFRESLRALASSPFAGSGRGKETFWALRGLDLDLLEGEVLGVIGRNGAGKSTLLKLISRITPPSTGRILIRGRVASLLEVGTGFHLELTGRDNIYLNGAILGMPKSQIHRKFDEIVEFAGVEQFIDTPVKHYSSGMLVRLAFAVAAHLDQELLLLDEVLAVGDANFQKRCIGKIRDIANATGRTVVFVSHNNAAVSSLCTRGIVLDQGQMQFDGSPQEAISFYNQSLARREFDSSGREDVPHVVSVRLDDAALAEGKLRLTVGFRSPRPLHPVLIGAVVHTLFGVPVFGFNTQMDPNFSPPPQTQGEAVLDIPNLPLHTGTYKLSIWFGEKNENFDIQHDVLTFDFVSPVPLPAGVSLDIAGPVALRGSWSLDG